MTTSLLPIGAPPDAQRAYAEEILAKSPNAAERAAAAVELAGLPKATDASDPAAPVGLEGISLDDMFPPLVERAQQAIAAVESDTDLNAEAVARKKHGLQPGREQMMRGVSAEFERRATQFLGKNLPPTAVPKPDIVATIDTLLRSLLPMDVVDTLARIARSDRAHLDIVIPVLRKLTQVPPKHWQNPADGSNPLAAASNLLVDLGEYAPSEYAEQRHKRAVKIVASQRQQLAGLARQFVATGRVGQ